MEVAVQDKELTSHRPAPQLGKPWPQPLSYQLAMITVVTLVNAGDTLTCSTPPSLQVPQRAVLWAQLPEGGLGRAQAHMRAHRCDGRQASLSGTHIRLTAAS